MKKIIFITVLLLAFTAIPKALALTNDDISAECACLIEAKTGKVLFAKNKDLKHAMASTTKIMTALIALEECDPEELVCVSASAAATEGSSIYLKAGEKIKMLDLLYGLMLNSGNDAAVAVAEHISGNTDNFCVKMNEKAASLGLTSTSFKNPNGLYDENHYSTASDLCILARYAMKNKLFREIVGTKTKTVTLPEASQELYFSNHNKLLWNYSGATGIKTGYTKDTGRCLVSSAEKDGTELICVTLNAPNDWNDHSLLLDYGFSMLEARIIIEKNQVMKTAEIDGKIYDFIAADASVLSLEHDSTEKALVNLKISEKLTGPFKKGEKVGEAEVIFNGEALDTVDIISETDIYSSQETEHIIKENLSFWDRLLNFFLKFLFYN